jgi:FkbM family methyltransferase
VSERLGRESRVIRALRPAYELLLDAASGGREVEWHVNDELFRIDPHVRGLIPDRTEPDLWSWLRSHVGPGEQVLDIGSFLGIYAMTLARWAGPGGRVLAFEPTPDVYRTLLRHVRLNGLAKYVHPFPIALGESAALAELHRHSDPYRNAINVTDPMGVGTGTATVEVATVDSICSREQFDPTLIRMDVQGFEVAVLRGARETLRRMGGRLRIVLEVHPQLWPLVGIDTETFDRTVAELGRQARPLERPAGGGYLPDEHVELVES